MASDEEHGLCVALLSVGDELVAGDILDTNAGWISRKLGEHGQELFNIATVRDDIGVIAQAVSRAKEDGADLVLVTGGLGPTADDVTRDGVAAALGVELHADPAILDDLRSMLARAGRRGSVSGKDGKDVASGNALAAGNARQALMPEGARVLSNPLGTAPGFHIERDGFAVVCMPGVPSEMKPMFVRFLEEHVPEGDAVPTRRLRACGVRESTLGSALEDLMGPRPGPRVGITVSRAILTVSIRGHDRGEVDEVEQEVRRRLGPHLFGAGDDLLETVVVQLLTERRQTITAAESCTGGMLTAAITSVSGSSEVFHEGAVTYANEVKAVRLGVPEAMLAEHGAVSEPVAKAMAEGQRQRAGADLGVGITGIAGPGGGTAEKPVGTVFIAVASVEGTRVIACRWRGSRDEVRIRSVNTALDAVRRHLLQGAS